MNRSLALHHYYTPTLNKVFCEMLTSSTKRDGMKATPLCIWFSSFNYTHPYSRIGQGAVVSGITSTEPQRRCVAHQPTALESARNQIHVCLVLDQFFVKVPSKLCIWTLCLLRSILQSLDRIQMTDLCMDSSDFKTLQYIPARSLKVIHEDE